VISLQDFEERGRLHRGRTPDETGNPDYTDGYSNN
jgi:hypothetical protein